MVLAEFKDHAGFDGVILGDPGAAWHLELTYHADHPGARAPTEKNLLVLYLPDTQAWRLRTQQMEAAGFTPVPALNPYWNAHGRSYADPDGWRTGLARMTRAR